MRLAHKLALLLAGASAGPLLLATAVTLPMSARRLRAQLDEVYSASALGLATEIRGAVSEKAEALELYAKTLNFASLGADQELLDGAMRLIYSQTKNAGVVAIIDDRGDAVAQPVFHARPREKGLPDQEAVSEQGLAAFSANVPFQEALLRNRATIGPIYEHPDESGRPMPRVVVAVPTAAPGGGRWVLAEEISLRPIVARLSGFSLGETGRASLLDAAGKTIWEGAPSPPGERLGATALVEALSWRVVVEQAASEALSPVRSQYLAAVLWAAIGLLAAVALGFTAVRTVTRPLGKLEEATGLVERGNLGVSVDIKSGDELGRLGKAFNTMIQGLKERERLRQSFSRYLSGEVAARILSERSDLDIEGEQVDVTIVFLDIRGFTSLSEQLPPREVVDMLNAYFERVVSVVMKYEGVVVKFIGDAVMAMFGVPKEIPHPELRAVTAAMTVQATIERFNQERQAKGLPIAHFGAGVNTGVAIAGNVGSSQRLEYTVIGDAVNLAERLQGLAKAGEVLITASTYQRLGGRVIVERRGQVKVKGKAVPIEVMRVVSASRDVTAIFKVPFAD